MQTYPTWPNLAAMMFDLARRWPDKPMLRAFRDGRWHTITWGEFGRAAASLRPAVCARRASRPGDRVRASSPRTGPEYPIAETALMAIRAVPVPAYITNTVEDHAHHPAGFAAPARRSSPPPALAGASARGAAPGRRPRSAGRHGWTGDARRQRVCAWAELVGDTAPPDDIAPEAAGDPADRAGLPDLHLRHRRRAARA